MRNIIGQTKSGFDLRDIMDNKKILLVNLSKGKTGELNSQLLGMIFVMKFQAAAMGRANLPEEQRTDFTLYVDEFQNFATDSFETILSEARKYRLNLILANQFMTQLTDKIREAIIGNVGTIISGRIGTTDAELMEKKFAPTFEAEDLTKLPNFETVASVMINNVPSAPFSMSLIPPLGQANPQLAAALKRLSAAKYGKPRAEVERAIFTRLRAGDAAREEKKKVFEDRLNASSPASPKTGGGSSFLDDWLAKRKQLQAKKGSEPKADKPQAETKPQAAPEPQAAPTPPVMPAPAPPVMAPTPAQKPLVMTQPTYTQQNTAPSAEQLENDQKQVDSELHKVMQREEVREYKANQAQELKIQQPRDPNDIHSLDEIYIDVRGNLHHRGDEILETAPASPQEQAPKPPAPAS
jgi:hypothetical protein